MRCLGDGDSNGLRWDDWKACQASISGHLPWNGDNEALQVQASAVEAGMLLDSVRIDARGSVQNLRLEADTRNELGALAVGGSVRQAGQAWRGELAALRVAPVKGAPWQLRQAAAFSVQGGNIALEGRIVALADVYDALRSERSYKPAFSHERSFDIITTGDGRTTPGGFDPKVMEIFRTHHRAFEEIYETCKED